jgi:hypothetical protein
MASQMEFGRRTTSQRPALRARKPLDAPPAGNISAFARASVAPASPLQPEISAQPADHELQEWKKTRRQNYKIPWRQMSLMASLCFGIGALVLPDSVNENLDWLLYGLMAASLFAGLRRRRRA